MIDIISGPLDADKPDYLLRDGYFAGVQYGIYDIERIISESCLLDTQYMGFNEGAVYALEQLLLAKHHMTMQVYSHRIRLISDSMIVRGIELAAEDDPVIEQLFVHSDSTDFRKGWIGLDDYRLIEKVRHSKSVRGKALFEGLEERRLLKRLCSIDLQEMKESGALEKDYVSRLQGSDLSTRESRKRIECAIAEEFGTDRDKTILNVWQSNDPSFKGSKTRLNPSAIVTRRDSGKTEFFTALPSVIGVHEGMRRTYVDVYAEITEPDRARRTHHVDSLRSQIPDLLKSILAKTQR